MTLSIPFDNSYARLPEQLFSRQDPTEVGAPKFIAFNAGLADQLGISGYEDNGELARVFAGNEVPKGADPIAQLYAAHQFGQWNPQLGDGRAILLGEVDAKMGRRDIQLKGSGPTPYSRNGDGRAWLGPVLREYIVSEAMHALGIPTTRALAAMETGEPVLRETVLPGAVITRVASSHMRVGTFQVMSARRDTEGLTALYEYAVDRHYPSTKDPLEFLKAVMDAQAALIAKWMSVGFIHGVMNTDNCAISGETIDYGPCAFMDEFDPMQVYSSIDRRGRYAYGNQPDIIVWNMAQLATALVPLMPEMDEAIQLFTQAVHSMPDVIQSYWTQAFGAKIGLANPDANDVELINGLLKIMAAQKADFTNTFRTLSADNARDQFTNPLEFDAWAEGWKQRIEREPSATETMNAANPWVIPRNHQIEAMIQSAVSGDYAKFHEMNALLATPYTEQPDALAYTRPPAEAERVQATFCGT